MRYLLDLMRGNDAEVKKESTQCQYLLDEASFYLKILDPEHGEEELVELVAAELAKLAQPLRKLSTLNPAPSTLNPEPQFCNPKL